MGRAIVRDPQVFLFDEPLSNLDAKLRVQMRAEIKELHQRLATTTVYVTHDQIEAMTMADKIVVMNSGNVEQTGAPLDLYDRPNNLFVAGFIGSPAMNFLKGQITSGTFRADGGAALPLPAVQANGSEGKPMLYGVRPEHFQLDAQGLPATVHVVEPTGSETQVMAEYAGTPIVCAFRERVSAKPGETIHITANPALVHLFDAGSGQRVSS
jgi:multiple sugar transport system ATP-binding protein